MGKPRIVIEQRNLLASRLGKRSWTMGRHIIFLCLCVVAISAITTIFGSSKPLEPGSSMDSDKPINPTFSDGFIVHRVPSVSMGVPVEPIVGGRGFAFQGNETHQIRISIERLVPLEPRQMRSFLASDKSIEEIKEAIKCEEVRPLHRGIMKLDNLVYPLTNIDIRPAGYDAAVIADADVASPGIVSVNQTMIVGHIIVTASTLKKGSIGKGQLNMKSVEHTGIYDVVLDMDDHAMAKQWKEKHERFEK
jgi:hypothetical protein